MKGIVVGIDGSSSSSDALRWAVEEAALHQCPVTAVLAWGFLDQHHVDTKVAFDPDYTHKDAAAALDAYLVRDLGADKAAGIGRRAICDLTVPALLDAAVDASLLVLGPRGLGGFKGLLLGSVTQQCIHHTTSPVVIVRTPARTSEAHMERIVVGVDGSQPSREALRWAAGEARLRRANLQVIMTWHTPYVGGYPFVGSPAFDPSVFERDAQKALDGLVDDVDDTGIPQVERVLTMGDAASALLTASKDADLLVVGSRGLGGFAGLLLGSVSHHLAHHATCPLVIIPPRT